MPCAHPITISHGKQSYRVPCRQCMPCRIQYQQQIIFAATNELQYAYRKGYGASFCTFTYDDEHLYTETNPNGSLRKSDVQLFLKRVRSNIDYKNAKQKFKYIAAGEYGDSFGRAHVHIVFIGLTEYETKAFAKDCWQKGLSDIQTLGRGGMRYVLKYCLKQITGQKAEELYDNQGLERPFLLRSMRMGYEWLNDNYDQLAQDNYNYIKNSKMKPLPKYYRNIVDKNKSYNNNMIMQSMKQTAESMDMSLYQYQRYVSLNLEKMLIQTARQSGQPVDDSHYIIDNHTYTASTSHRMMDDLISSGDSNDQRNLCSVQLPLLPIW